MSKEYAWPLIVSFFTPDYFLAANNLILSLDRLGLEHRVERIEDRGSWVRNCAHKPQFLWEMMRDNRGRAICWIDADAIVVSRPTLFKGGLDCDVAVHSYQRPNRNAAPEVLSGTVYLAPTFEARLLVDRWIEECAMRPAAWDQRALQSALEKVDGLRLWHLPVEYCWIFDKHREEYPDKTPVVEHFQRSRVTKKRRGG